MESNFKNDYIECLMEMASVRPQGDQLGILLSINPDDNHDGDPYFKMYDALSFYSATKVWRISFQEPKLIKKHKGKIPAAITINSDEKKKLIQYLNLPSRDFKSYKVWDELKYRWNLEKGLLNQFGFLDYMNGHADKFYKNKDTKGSYIPSTLQMPDYSNL